MTSGESRSPFYASNQPGLDSSETFGLWPSRTMNGKFSEDPASRPQPLLPPGFETSFELWHSNNTPLSNMMSATDSNFVSENSLNSILRNAQQHDDFETTGSGSDPGDNTAEDSGNHFFDQSGMCSNLLNSTMLESDSGFSALDSSVDTLDTSQTSNNSFASGSHNTSVGNWGSPVRSINNSSASLNVSSNFGMNSEPPHSPCPPGAAKLTHKDYIILLQKLTENLSDRPSDATQAQQILVLMQVIQAQLMAEMNSGHNSLPSPNTPGHSSTSSSSLLDSPIDHMRNHREFGYVSSDPIFTWSGQLPPRIHRNPIYSCKIFLGGVPFDITESALVQAFKPFGNVKIEWPPRKDATSQPKGYLYVIFEHQEQVKHLLQNCFLDYSKCHAGDWYFKLTSKKFREKDVQVIPWAHSDSTFVKCQSAKIDGKKTIFVGALHGMLNAEGLATIMNDLFGGVVYAGIDTDKYKYPIGSGRVTFNNIKSYMKAVSAAFVEIKTKFRKKVQVDPYLEDSTCSVCGLQQGPYFCRDKSCFRYFCRTCFQNHHNTDDLQKHRPLMRNASKPVGAPGSVTSVTLSPVNNNRQNQNNDSYGPVTIGSRFGNFGNGGHLGHNGNNSWGSNMNPRPGIYQHPGRRQDFFGARFSSFNN